MAIPTTELTTTLPDPIEAGQGPENGGTGFQFWLQSLPKRVTGNGLALDRPGSAAQKGTRKANNCGTHCSPPDVRPRHLTRGLQQACNFSGRTHEYEFRIRTF